MGIEEIQQTQIVYGNGTVCESERSRQNYFTEEKTLCLRTIKNIGSPYSVSAF